MSTQLTALSNALRDGASWTTVRPLLRAWVSYEEAARQQGDRKTAELIDRIEKLEAAGTPTQPPPTQPPPTEPPTTTPPPTGDYVPPVRTRRINVAVGQAPPSPQNLQPGDEVVFAAGFQGRSLNMAGVSNVTFRAADGAPAGSVTFKGQGSACFLDNTKRCWVIGIDFTDCSIAVNVKHDVREGTAERNTQSNVFLKCRMLRTSDSAIIDYGQATTFVDCIVEDAGDVAQCHGVYLNGPDWKWVRGSISRCKTNGLSIRERGQQLGKTRIRDVPSAVAFFNEVTVPGEVYIEGVESSGTSTAIYLSAAGGWPGGDPHYNRKPSWIWPTFRFGGAVVLKSRGGDQGINAEVPVQGVVNGHLPVITFDESAGKFASKERYADNR